MGRRLLLIGGGGHCHSVIDCIMSSYRFEKIAIVDSSSETIENIPIVGCDEDLPVLFKRGWTDAFVSVGSVGCTDTRRRLYNLITNIGFSIPTIIDSTAIIADNVRIGEGVFIGKRVILNSGSVIGNCSIINSGAIIEHDCNIGEFSHVSSGAILCGNTFIGKDAHIGAGSTIRQGINIGEHTLIGIGSVVVSDVSHNVVAYGNPCKVVKK